MSETDCVTPPLCVDLDGTLSRTDLTAESLLALGKHHPLRLLGLTRELTRGRAACKLALARLSSCDPATLPYNEAVLELVRAAHAEGRRTVLVSASPRPWVESVASHLGLFDDVLATDDPGINLAGSAKAARLVALYGEKAFDYAGNARADLPVWRHARRTIVVTPQHGVLARARAQGEIAAVVDDRPLRSWT